MVRPLWRMMQRLLFVVLFLLFGYLVFELIRPPHSSLMGARYSYFHDNSSPHVRHLEAGNQTEIRHKDGRMSWDDVGYLRKSLDLVLEAERKKLKVDMQNPYFENNWPLARDIPDTRHPACRNKEYPVDLPTVAIVICFRNESALMLGRTIHTVMKRSPEHVLEQIILVDDNGIDGYDNIQPEWKDKTQSVISEREAEMIILLEKLKRHPKITIVKNEKTEGLIRARTIGASHVRPSAEVIFFLDSHCEVGEKWLEPMLLEIKKDPTAVVMPVLDIIDDSTFEYKAGANNYRGGFTKRLDFKWIPLANWQEPHKPGDEIQTRMTPAMPGGLFAIHKDFWHHIGTYDQGMDIWGGENVEISVRIWMCGGSMAFIPCSRVGHMFRINYKKFKDNFPYAFPNGAGSTVLKNKVRAVEVWMDDYKPAFYEALFGKGNNIPPPHYQMGDVSDRKELREKLQCQSFDWFLKNVYPEFDLND